jgi:hypothetical protein
LERKTALDFAIENNKHDVVALLRSVGAAE